MKMLLLLVTVLAVDLNAYADIPQTPIQAPLSGKTSHSPRARAVLKTNQLTEPVDFPNVPRYTGKAVFLRGFTCPDEHYVGMTLGVNEPPDQVKHWYEDTLTTYSWKILKNSSGPNQVIAVREDSTFSVTILPRPMEGVRTVVDLSFYGR